MCYDLVIFDCDGTLVDSEYLNIKAIVSFLNDFGIHDYDIEYGLSHFSGFRFSAIIGKIAQETGFTFPDNASKLYLSKVRALASTDMKRIENADKMVECASRNTKVCVVSNGERQNVLSSIHFAGLDTFFPDQNVISGLMAPNPKPAPDLFLLAAQQHDVSPHKCLVIEDSSAGVTGAHAANMDVWGFCGTHHAPKEHADALIKAGAEKTFLSMQDMIETFQSRLDKI
ncbi:MAG: HAD family hydrolase [Alphaproteobacteria bacterium]